MSKVLSKVLYFMAGAVPTGPEAAAILRLETVFHNVQVRNGGLPIAQHKFGSNFEAFDFLAGTTIPAEYSAIDGAVTISAPSAVAPDQFKLFPATCTIDASDVDKAQLCAVKAEIDPATGLAKMTDVSGDASVTYSSSDTGKATIGATGLLTAVAAGSTTITATLTAGTAVTGGAIEADDDIYTKTGHGFVTGDALKLVSLTGGTGLTAGTTYYFHKLGANTGYLCSSYANAIAATPVAVTVDASSVVLVAAPQTSTTVVTVQA